MEFILIFIAAVTATPAQLGTYSSEASCNAAIRQIYESRLGFGAISNPAVKQAVDVTIQYQREYICVKK